MVEPQTAESTEQRESGDEMLVKRGEPAQGDREIHGQGGSPQAARQNTRSDPNPSVPRTGERAVPVEEKGFTAKSYGGEDDVDTAAEDSRD